ncbi:hypothetical protein HETIRDRAFT_416284 [Heterobasidion irregulare TC 32-1]|uniref:Uncharacterized protein n=1 Tax=Heterobasidion irregulare (strain TC 32-1) TaxID=747525 RepID=W4KHP5_HETIT|nr:uncharacterized protein HETIRDRAFT_416284 [Heterobasidion irregulare TC 32-1]ETW84601.1 hypothetical protein HETIRDRAFT_416284 [Heterobasidion irregulare TC 32-1]
MSHLHRSSKRYVPSALSRNQDLFPFEESRFPREKLDGTVKVPDFHSPFVSDAEAVDLDQRTIHKFADIPRFTTIITQKTQLS